MKSQRLEGAAAALLLPLPPQMHTDDGLSTFLRLRPRLVGIAHRMLGTAADAEDVLQDVWMRWQTTDRTAIRNAAAFLTTTTTRLAINVMQSAHARREVSVGAWLPEPIAAGAHPGSDMEQREAIESGLLVLLAHLSRKERLAYILREAFDYPYRDIASVLRLGEANARQVVTRARRHVVVATSIQARTHSGRATGKDDPNETRHHRRHRTHRIQAGAQAA